VNGVEAGMTEANEQHEPSYYEIALTNRQVMAAFVILLLCVLGAFFSGVWVGRGGRTDRRAAASAGQAQATPSGQPMQELQFFSPKSDKAAEKPAAAVPPASAPPASASTSLATDLQKPTDAAASAAPAASGDVTEPAASTVEPASPSTSATPSPAPPVAGASSPAPAVAGASSTAPVATAPDPVAVKPAPAASASKASTVPPVVNGTLPGAAGDSAGKAAASGIVTAPKAVAPARSTELAPGEMVVQVFSTSDGEQAKKTLQRVNKAGYKAYLSPIQVGTQTMYRVRIGPFTDRASAQKVADLVRKRFKLDTWITR